MTAHVRRVRLELDVEDVLLALRNVAEVERQGAVTAPFGDRRGLDRVQRVVLEPALAENERRLLDLPLRRDREAGLPEQSAANGVGGADREGRLGGGRLGGRCALAEDVEERKQDEQRQHDEQPAAHPDVPAATLHVAVAADPDALRRGAHRSVLSASNAFLTSPVAT